MTLLPKQLFHSWSCQMSFGLTQILRLTVSMCIFLFSFSDKNLNFIGQLFRDNGNRKSWKDLKIEFHLKDTHKIYWFQIIDALPTTWKDVVLKDKGNVKNLVIFENHIARNYQICSLNKLTSKMLYLIPVEVNTIKPTAQGYFETFFWNIPV